MAEKILNSRIEDIFIESDVTERLKQIIEEKFTYSNITIFCEIEDEIINLIKVKFKSLKCKIFIVDKLDKVNENTDLIVAIGDDEIINKTKILSTNIKLPFVLICTKFENSFAIENYAIEDENVITTNYPMYVIIDQGYNLENSKGFLSNACATLSSIHYYLMQNEINYYFDFEKIDFVEVKKLQDLSLKAQAEVETFFFNEKKVVEHYIKMLVEFGLILNRINYRNSALFIYANLVNSFCKERKIKISLSNLQYFCANILISVCYEFFNMFDKKLTTSINYEMHLKRIKHKNSSYYLKTIENFKSGIDFKKTSYILNETKDIMIDVITKNHKQINNFLENMRYFDLKNIYELKNIAQAIDFKGLLPVTANLVGSGNIVHIISHCGFLNF